MTARRQNDVLLPGDYEALADLRYTLRRFTAFSVGEAQRLGITPQQHQALLAIKGLPADKEMTVGMLADRLLISPESATVLTTTLTEAGYVEHATSRTDGRRKIVALTKKAEHILEKLSGAHLHEIRDMASELMHALRILQDRRKQEQIAWMS
jgi:DNA-binding MarR family transcriptional regulator